ncbi:MAG: CBS domain-containing protein [Chloroflexi bacterium]|nr:MAG: CBS domain-containing protein [Chloroflexota bacterium]TMG37650.1 MAG: CBS domain-containing protein [Chloroflexota bacterium]TMG41672.1 MAG: CBS domain-containing protein [Chloroflexota bacterium]
MTIARLAGLDLVAVAVAYLVAVAFRVGGRVEIAEPEQAVALAALAAAVQVGGNAALGVYRKSWYLSRSRDLVDLGAPALAAALVVAALNVSTGLHGVPFAALPVAAVLAFALLVARRLRRRWRTIIRAILGQREVPLSPFVPLGAAPDPARAIIPSTASIRAAMEAIDRDVSRIALLVGAGGELVGTVTDGDARRAILAGTSLDSPASSIMKAQPVVAERDMTDDEIVALMLTRSVRQVPVVDESGRVLDIKLLDRMTRTAEEPVPVLIMAGGLGRRLGDITRYIPKPLVEVAGRPILATLIQDLAAQGFRRVILSVGHKAELIERYFGDGRRFGVTISYVRDGRPLGTAGAIAAALPQLEREFIVTNADLLTRVNFGELVAFHRAERDDLTIGIIESTYELRYGLVEIDGTRVTGIREKPELRHFVNGGIYVLEPKLGRLVPADTRFDMDQLIRAALAQGFRVGCFPIHEFWADIGEPADLKQASTTYDRRATDPKT